MHSNWESNKVPVFSNDIDPAEQFQAVHFGLTGGLLCDATKERNRGLAESVLMKSPQGPVTSGKLSWSFSFPTDSDLA